MQALLTVEFCSPLVRAGTANYWVSQGLPFGHCLLSQSGRGMNQLPYSLASQALAVPRIRVSTRGPSSAQETPRIRLASAGLVLSLRHGIWEGEDLGGGLLGSDDDQGRGVGGDHSGEDGGVDDEEVVGSVDLGVEIYDGGAAVAAVVAADLGGSDPVVCTAVAGGDDHLFLC